MELEESLQRAITDQRPDAFGRIGPRFPRALDTDARLLHTMPNLRMAVVEADASNIEDIKENADVAYVEKEFFIPSPPAVPQQDSRIFQSGKRGSTAELTWGLKAINAPQAWKAVRKGIAGFGAKVVVLDTGIDRDHVDLKGRFFAGKNFVQKGQLDEQPGNNSLGLFATLAGASLGDAFVSNDTSYDFYDQLGHGTHVAGTILAELNGQGVVGVAPRAQVLAGKVCGRFGCSSISIIEGVQWAIQQKADVINMSLGGPMSSRAQNEALAAAEAAGVVNVAASGNGGNAKVSFPAAYDSVLAVGAVDPNIRRATFSQYGPELDVVAPGTEVLSSVPVGSGRDSEVLIGTGKTKVNSSSFIGSAELFDPITAPLKNAGLGLPEDFKGGYQGTIALIERGQISFADKVKNAINAGASGILIYNNAPGLISGALTQDGSSLPVAVAMVEQDVGREIATKLANAQKVEASIRTIKTDYAVMQGTSMATPHAAGVAALVRAVNPRLTPAEVRDIMKSTATPINPSGSDASAESSNEYGQGIINAEAAVAAALRTKL